MRTINRAIAKMCTKNISVCLCKPSSVINCNQNANPAENKSY